MKHLFAQKLRRSPERRLRTLMQVLLCVAASTVAASAGVERGREADVKAAFLYNFTRFVEWPREKFESEAAPFVIGFFGSNEFADELKKTIGTRKAGGRAVSVRVLKSLDEARAAHLVFVSGSDTAELRETLAALQEAGVLTVGDSASFAAATGMITFTFEGDKLRFAINLKASEDAGLKISAQLLKLATNVRR